MTKSRNSNFEAEYADSFRGLKQMSGYMFQGYLQDFYHDSQRLYMWMFSKNLELDRQRWQVHGRMAMEICCLG